MQTTLAFPDPPALALPDQPITARVLRAPSERAARASLREQIARLERELALRTWELWQERVLEPVGSGAAEAPQGRLLTLAELEAARDALVARVQVADGALRAHADSQAQARTRLDAMLAEPEAHRFEVVRRVELGEPSCGAYRVAPRLGLLGMLFGWWCVKLSSGCP